MLQTVPRVLLLGGGHAAGKTTALRRAQARHAHRSDWVWYSPDHGGPLMGKSEKQLATFMRIWSNRTLIGIAIECTRFYSTVFRCMQLNTYPRHLYIGLINRPGTMLRDHVRARCERVGKPFNAESWEKNVRLAEYEARHRIPNALATLFSTSPDLKPRIHARTFEMDLHYTQWAVIHEWVDWVVSQEGVG